MKLINRWQLTDAMDVRFLTTFLEVSQTRHFGKAAENLYLTQSAVSARIKLLEEYFNTALFVRHRNSIQLTAAGEKLLPFAQQISATLAEARKELSEEDVDYLVCAATPNASELYLHDALSGLQQRFSNLSIRAEIYSIEQISRQLHERNIDVAYTLDPLKSDEVDQIAVHQDSLSLYGYKVDSMEEALARYIHIDWGNKISDHIYQQFPQARRAKLRTSSYRVALDSFFDDCGCAVLPERVIAQHPRSKDIVRLEDLDMALTTYLAYMKDIKHAGLEDVIAFQRPAETA
ncbi:LysR family transcriptional regulator [Aestuariibacter halophilus]|uniref:LysR family transcriptional regulator n=1 Tax=Fluctibacter halophilus TaxID=226011 RepID=A0ABS8GAH0_9ALTE|nr:LysR family transcriptional regulator [Aestuariibacter halophilus]MCC2617579.1 LysR family transcriptional regulator [Aestuariibacter halophilus]